VLLSYCASKQTSAAWMFYLLSVFMSVFLLVESTDYFFPGRVRIAHVPNVLHLLNAKMRMQAAFEKRKQDGTASVPTSKGAFSESEGTESYTVIQTVPKGGHRVAHRPSTVGCTLK